MFSNLKPQPSDKILELMQMFREDTRADKIDLGVGVYKDADGRTPVMRAIKAAEKKLWEEETTKSYTALAGDPAFSASLSDLILGDALPKDRLASIATPGGTGAVRLGFELAKMASPGMTLWVSDPTWPNHTAIAGHVGLPIKTYRYFDEATRAVDFEGMVADLSNAKPGDVVLLHGCCHNPTGANPNIAQWGEIAEVLLKTGASAMIDIAYQGFGDGLDADAAPTRLLVKRLPELLIAASCSKNFGVYRERTGLLMALTQSDAERAVTQANLASLNRLTYSFPPDHGARLVTMVLTDPALRADWEAELEEVRLGMLKLREQLADSLRQETGSDRFGFLAAHRGMFSKIGATPEQVERIRTEFGIYMIGDSRLNIAGLNQKTVPLLAKAIKAVGV